LTLDLIGRIRNHDGREISTGGSSILGSALSFVPGTESKDFAALVKQLKGKQFLAAYQELKGGGTITEIEGVKAETALSNLDTSQSEEQFLENLDVLESVITKGMERAQAKTSSKVIKWEDL
jgi:hypothetical protein